MAGPLSLRRLSRSIPRKCLTTCRQTIDKLNNSKTFLQNQPHNNNHHTLFMKIFILLLIFSIWFTFQSATPPAGSRSNSAWMEVEKSNDGEKTMYFLRNFKTAVNVSCDDVVAQQRNTSGGCCNASNVCSGVIAANRSFNDYCNKLAKSKIHSWTKIKHHILIDDYIHKEVPLNIRTIKKISLLSTVVFISIITLHLHRALREQVCLASPQSVTWQLLLFRLLPLRTLSRINGRLTRITVPIIFRYILWGVFIRLFGVKIHEAREESLASYKCFQDLFKRRLKPRLRPISEEGNLVCPVDGTVMSVGPVVNKCVEQVKGVTYSLKAFLGRGQVREGMKLYSVALYLSPGDYHRFHSPANWTVDLYRHFPGELVTVSPWAVRNMPGLFALNERVLVSGSWEYGYFSLTAVGAFNVGSIYLDNYQDLHTNIKGHYRFNTYTDKHTQHSVVKGEHMGGFNIGSTVVLLFEAPPNFKFSVSVGDKVQYGRQLGGVV